MDQRFCSLAQDLVFHSKPCEFAVMLLQFGLQSGVRGRRLTAIKSTGHD
jgi:hypothetical protein